MPLTSIPLPFGIRDISLKPFTDAGWTTPGTKVDLPYGRTLSFSEAEDFEELRGDDTTVTTRGKGPSVDWELESGGISLDALKIIAGGTVTTSGTTPAQIKTYSKLASDVRPYFKCEGQAISDSGGDLHTVLYRCRATGEIAGEFSDGAFFLTSAKGTSLGSFESAKVGALYDFVQNETAVANA